MGEPWSSFWSLGGCFEGPWGALGRHWELHEGSLGVLGGSLGGPWGAHVRKRCKTNGFLTFSRGVRISNPAKRQPSRGDGRGKGRETLPGFEGVLRVLRFGGPASTRPEAMLASADMIFDILYMIYFT